MVSAGRGTCGAVAIVAGALVVSQLRRTFREDVGTLTKRMPTRPVKACQTTSPESRTRDVAGQSNSGASRAGSFFSPNAALPLRIDQRALNSRRGILRTALVMYSDASILYARAA
jgi:hypothetical protein